MESEIMSKQLNTMSAAMVKAQGKVNAKAEKSKPKAATANVVAFEPKALQTLRRKLDAVMVAIKAHEAAGQTMRDKVIAMASGQAAISELDYTANVAPLVRDALAHLVTAKALTQNSANAYGSWIKGAYLGLVNGIKPDKGELLREFSQRARVAMANGKVGGMPNGRPIFLATVTGKAKGRPAAPKAPTSKPLPGAEVAAVQAQGSAPEFKGSPQMAAALILTHGHKPRAEKLVLIFASEDLRVQFDKWSKDANIGADAPKA